MKECRACGLTTFDGGRCTDSRCLHRELTQTEIEAAQYEEVRVLLDFLMSRAPRLARDVGSRNSYLITQYALLRVAVDLARFWDTPVETLVDILRLIAAKPPQSISADN